MRVEFIDKLGSDLTVVNAARVSFAKQKQKFNDDDQGLLNYLAEHGHWSPFAHPQLQLRVTAPIAIARQLGKHQIGLTWNEISRRYVDYRPESHVPNEWRGRAANKKQGSGKPIDDDAEIRRIYKLSLDIAHGTYAALLASGVCPEQARFVLPQAMFTQWFWTGSLMAFARICKLRCADDAQAETREIGRQIANIASRYFPAAWAALTNEKALSRDAA